MAGPVPVERAASIVVGALGAAERAGGVAYLCLTRFAAGQRLAVPGQPLAIDRDGWIGFVDPEPRANWGHACRYLLIDALTGEVTSHPRRFPAFEAGDDQWRVVYRASG